MPIVQFEDKNMYGKAVAALLRAGWGIEARGGQGLVVTPYQLRGLVERGLVSRSELERFVSEGILSQPSS